MDWGWLCMLLARLSWLWFAQLTAATETNTLQLPTSLHLDFLPILLYVYQGQTSVGYVNVTFVIDDINEGSVRSAVIQEGRRLDIRACCMDSHVADLVKSEQVVASMLYQAGVGEVHFNKSRSVEGEYVHVPESTNITQVWDAPEVYNIVVRSPPDPASFYLSATALGLVALNLVGVGGQVDGDECVQLLKKPLAIGVAMFCRFGVLPALTLGIVELIQADRNSSIGVLSLICAPAEGASNLLLLLAEGELTFSVTLTSINNFATIALVPLWTIVYEILIYSKPGHVTLPFKDSFSMFCYIITACITGFLMQKKLKFLYNKLWLYLPGFTIMSLAFIVIVEIYNNRFVFALITMETLLLSLLITCSGFVFGAVVAFLGRLSKPQILVNCIECGTRTTYITTLMLEASLASPEADMAKAAPVLSSLFSLLPTMMFVIMFRVYQKHFEKIYSNGSVFVGDIDEEVAEILATEEQVMELKETCI